MNTGIHAYNYSLQVQSTQNSTDTIKYKASIYNQT